MYPRVVVRRTGVASGQTFALRKFRAFARKNEIDASIWCIVRNDCHLATAAPSILAWTGGVAEPSAEQITHRKRGLDCLDVGHSRYWVWNLTANVNPVGESACAASACE